MEPLKASLWNIIAFRQWIRYCYITAAWDQSSSLQLAALCYVLKWRSGQLLTKTKWKRRGLWNRLSCIFQHKARFHTLKSSWKASRYPITATLCSQAMSHLHCQRTKRKIGGQRWSERNGGERNKIKKKRDSHFSKLLAFRIIDKKGGRWRIAGLLKW